jgi:hypothetical protein
MFDLRQSKDIETLASLYETGRVVSTVCHALLEHPIDACLYIHKALTIKISLC